MWVREDWIIPHQVERASTLHWQTHWCRPLSCPCPGHSSQCQTWKSAVSWRAPCSTSTVSCFHFLWGIWSESIIEEVFFFLLDKHLLPFYIILNHLLVWNDQRSKPLNQFWVVPLTTCYIVSIRCQTHKVLLVDVAFKGAQTMRLVHVPEFQLAVCWSVRDVTIELRCLVFNSRVVCNWWCNGSDF